MKMKRIVKWSFLAILLVLFAWIELAYWTSTNDCDQKTGAPTDPMKAIRYCEYGPPDEVLKLEQVEKPVPNNNQILVRVRAVSLRFYDGGMLRGGLNKSIAEGYVQLGVSMREGKMQEDYWKNRPALGKIKLEDFAKEFAAAYNAK